MKKKPHVVVVGGGSGTYSVLSGLKKYPLNLSAVITMSDSGGSTGRLRDQLGVLPPGDLRQALVALSESDEIWRNLFTYRFESGDLDGHSFGNIFLSSLEKITGSLEKSIELASRILKARGRVIPVTYSNTVLCAKYADGTAIEGEKLIDESSSPRAKILYMYLIPEADVNPAVLEVVESADYIVFGPGDLYTSIIPNLLVNGVPKLIKASKAKKVFFMNLMTKLGQTDKYRASDYVGEMLRYLGGSVLDYIFVNNKRPDPQIIDWYMRAGDVEMVKDNLVQKKYPKTRIIRTDLLSEARYEQAVSDRIKRSLIRHDPRKIADTLYKLINKS